MRSFKRFSGFRPVASFGVFALCLGTLVGFSDQPAWAVPTEHDALLPLARRMGFQGEDGPERLLQELRERRRQIHQIFEKYFAAETEV